MWPVESRDQKQIHFCAICGGPGGTKHHLLPKSTRREWRGPGGTQLMPTMRTCRKCHDDIHYYLSHWELAVKFNTEERIRGELAKRKAWPKNDPAKVTLTPRFIATEGTLLKQPEIYSLDNSQ